jgi:hypothetical protein
MFVIDGVKLRLLKQSHQMREFKRNRAVGFQPLSVPW